MSDWLTHIGLAYGPARGLARPRLRLVLLGAVLPDAGTPLVVAANLLHLHPGAVETYLQPLQAPLPTGLLAVALALLAPPFGRSLFALGLGIATHYILDLSQIRYGGGIYLAYPFNFWSPSFDLYWPESTTNLILLGLGVVGVVWALLRPGPRIRWQVRRWPVALAVLGVALVLPILTRHAFFAANANNVAFFADPERFEGRRLPFAKLQVVEVAPDGPFEAITVRKGQRLLSVHARAFESWGRPTETPPAPGDRISFHGTYRRGVIQAPGPVHIHFRPLRTWTSLVGLILLALLLLPDARPRFQRRER